MRYVPACLKDNISVLKSMPIHAYSLQGVKIKNIENLMYDLLRETTPDAICIHAATNNINDKNSVDEITGEMNDLIHAIKNK